MTPNSNSQQAKRQRRLAVVLLATLLSGCLHTGAAPPDDALLADRLRIEAMISADPEGLDLALHPSLTYTHSTGRVDTKADLVDSLVSGRVRYLTIEPQAPELRVRGESAIVTAPVKMRVVVAGATHSLRSVTTATYWFEDGRWQLVAYHSSAAQAP